MQVSSELLFYTKKLIYEITVQNWTYGLSFVVQTFNE